MALKAVCLALVGSIGLAHKFAALALIAYGDRDTSVSLSLVVEPTLSLVQINLLYFYHNKNHPQGAAFIMVVYMVRFKGKPRFRGPLVIKCELLVRLVFLTEYNYRYLMYTRVGLPSWVGMVCQKVKPYFS